MRAVVCEEWGGPELLVVKELPDPVAGPGEVVVRIQAAGVNFPDVIIIQKKYQLQPPLPFIPGAEFAGEVISLGDGVTSLKAGDLVSGIGMLGGFAEKIAIGADKCFRLPAGTDLDIAAGFALAYGTSWHAVKDRGALQAGETMLVLGAAGGVGLAAVEIGKALGARVVAAASSDEKCALAKAHGADEAFNYATEDLRAGIKRTCGAGPDVIFDPVGDKFAEPAFRSIGWRGRYLVVGFAGGAIPSLPLNLTLLKGASIVGVFWGDHTKREPALHAQGMRELMGLVAAGTIRPLVSKTYALAEVPQALRDMAARLVTGKIVVRPQE
jgi:NADPH2:quinone reductase